MIVSSAGICVYAHGSVSVTMLPGAVTFVWSNLHRMVGNIFNGQSLKHGEYADPPPHRIPTM